MANMMDVGIQVDAQDETQLPGPEECVADIKTQDEALELLEDLRKQLNELEHTYKRSIRKVHAIPLLKRCIQVIEKSTGSTPQQLSLNFPNRTIQALIKNAYIPTEPVFKAGGYKKGDGNELNIRELKGLDVLKMKQGLYQQALGKFKFDISVSERMVRAVGDERTVQERKEELMELFRRVDMEQPKPERKSKVALEEVTNKLEALSIPETSYAHKSREVVMRTEIVPMLPCKGYQLPRGNLFISGKFRPIESEAELKRAVAMKEKDEDVRKEIRRGMVLRAQNATREREDRTEGDTGTVKDVYEGAGCVVD